MRERGSSTARPTEKGIGGLPIVSRFGRFGRFRRVDSVDSVAIWRADCVGPVDSVASIRSIRRVDRVEVKAQTQKKPDSSIGESGLSYRKASRALNLPLAPLSNTRASARGVRLGLACRSRRVGVLLVSRFGRFGRVDAPRPMPKARRKHKKARFLNRRIGLSYRKASCALNLPLAPLSNTRASARSVRLGLARRSCIVMPTSGRRRIGRYI